MKVRVFLKVTLFSRIKPTNQQKFTLPVGGAGRVISQSASVNQNRMLLFGHTECWIMLAIAWEPKCATTPWLLVRDQVDFKCTAIRAAQLCCWHSLWTRSVTSLSAGVESGGHHCANLFVTVQTTESDRVHTVTWIACHLKAQEPNFAKFGLYVDGLS